MLVCTTDPISCELWSSEIITLWRGWPLKSPFAGEKKFMSIAVGTVFRKRSSLSKEWERYYISDRSIYCDLCLWQNWWSYKNYSLQKISWYVLTKRNPIYNWRNLSCKGLQPFTIDDLRNSVPVGSQSTLSEANNKFYDKRSLENRAHS